jgi:DNA-binding MarR family transcriptional regulator
MSTAAVMFHTALAEKQGLSVTEEKAIDLLARFGPISAGDLSTKSGLAPASVTGLIDRLERKGFAERVKSPEDGRKVLVKLREDPAQAFAPHFAYFVGGLEQLLAGYTVEQLEAILHFMTESTALQQRATARLSGTPEEPT